MLSMVYTFYIGVPHIAMPSEPVMISSDVVRVTCGQNMNILSISNIKALSLVCPISNGSDILNTEVFKDGILIGNNFSITIHNRFDSGTYTFVVYYTNCVSVIARSSISFKG